VHLRLERHAGDNVLEVCFGDLVVGLVDQAAAHGLDDVRTEGAPFQAGSVRHENVKIALLQRLDIRRRRGVGDDDLSAQVVGQVGPDLQEVAGDDIRLLAETAVLLGGFLLLLGTHRVKPAEGKLSHDGQKQNCHDVHGADAADGDGEVEREHEVAEGNITAGIDEGLGQTVAVDGCRLEGFLAAQVKSVLFKRLNRQRGEEMLDAVAIPHLGDFDGFADPLDLAEIIAPVIHPQIEFRPAHAKGVHFAVVVAVHLDGAVEISVRALTAEPEMLPHELGFRSVISGRRAQADTQYFLHSASILQS